MAYTLIHFGSGWFFSRGTEMGLLADSVVHGHGLSSPFGPFTGPTAMVAPGYPLFVALVFYVLGSYSTESAILLMMLNAVSNVTTVLLIYRLGKRIASERSSFTVALFWAISVPLLWMPTIFWETSISATLLLVIVWTTLCWWTDDSMPHWAIFGALCGVAALINPALLPSAIALALLRWFHMSRSKWMVTASVFFLTFLLVFASWPLRNLCSLHAVVLTRSTFGLELWMGNHRGGNGYLETSFFPTYNRDELTRFKQLGEIAYMDQKERHALGYIDSRPGTFVLLSCKRCFRFWTGSGTRGGSALFYLHATLSSLMGLAGIRLLWLRGRGDVLMCLFLPLLLFPLPYYLTHAEFKYRLIVDPLLAILGAGVLDVGFRRWSQKHWEQQIGDKPITNSLHGVASA